MRNTLDNCPHHQSWKQHVFSRRFQVLLNNSCLDLDDILNLTWIMKCGEPIGHNLPMQKWIPMWMIKDTNHIIEFVEKHPEIYKCIGSDTIRKNSFIVFRITPIDINWPRYCLPCTLMNTTPDSDFQYLLKMYIHPHGVRSILYVYNERVIFPLRPDIDPLTPYSVDYDVKLWCKFIEKMIKTGTGKLLGTD